MAGTIGNVKLEPCTATWGGTDLGFTDGDIEVNFDEQLVDIMAHQKGTGRIDALRSGMNMEVSLSLKETSITQLTTIFTAAGATAVARAEVSTVTFVADVAGSLNNKYFSLYSASNATRHYVWFNINAAGADPAPSGYDNGIEVAGATGASAATLASAANTAIDAEADFISTVSSAVVTITNAATGGATDAADVNAGVTCAVTTQGIGALPGWGSSKHFGTLISAAANELVLHPVVLGSTTYTRDMCFWKAYPVMESLAFSGESILSVPVKFLILPDYNQPSTSEYFVYGAHYSG